MRHSGNMGKGSEAKMNRAAAEEPKSKAREKPHTAGVGNERKAEVKATQDGGSMAEAKGSVLSGAMKELHMQHPHAHSDHGPHHGTTTHIRHKPMHRG